MDWWFDIKGEKKMIDKEKITDTIRKGLEWQFDNYSFGDMINDLDLTDEEKKWAKENLTYDVRESKW